MRALLFASAAILGFSASVAMAGEGNGDPFGGVDAAVTTHVGANPTVPKSQDPYQFHAADSVTQMNHYTAMAGTSTDPFPFRGRNQVIGSPTSSAVAGNQQPTATDTTQQAATPHG